MNHIESFWAPVCSVFMILLLCLYISVKQNVFLFLSEFRVVFVIYGEPLVSVTTSIIRYRIFPHRPMGLQLQLVYLSRLRRPRSLKLINEFSASCQYDRPVYKSEDVKHIQNIRALNHLLLWLNLQNTFSTRYMSVNTDFFSFSSTLAMLT